MALNPMHVYLRRHPEKEKKVILICELMHQIWFFAFLSLVLIKSARSSRSKPYVKTRNVLCNFRPDYDNEDKENKYQFNILDGKVLILRSFHMFAKDINSLW